MAHRQESEALRLRETRELGIPWKKWGPYLSERQWGTVREDYSQSGNAWDYFSHDQARSRAYRWGEDGLAGVCDDQQYLCFALALWNGADPILKERLYGLTNGEGNHGEDVKEYYFYLDSTPTHSYMKYLYKYPQRAFPYVDLIETNRRRGRGGMEYELIDTGIFDDDRYFDVVVEYAKGGPEDLLIQISAWNRGPEAAVLHLLPTLWFRNTWSWSPTPPPRPLLRQVDPRTVVALHDVLGERYLSADRAGPWLFTENETNTERIFRTPNASRYVKDAIDQAIVRGAVEAVNPQRMGTKAAAHYALDIPGAQAAVVRLRLGPQRRPPADAVGPDFEHVMQARLREADAFYADVIPAKISADEQAVMRQGFAGMLWSKQFYCYPVNKWLNAETLPPDCQLRETPRNRQWFHLESADVISMPDKWEYPWFAAWDLAFHCMVLARVDLDLAKEQLQLITNQLYLHPSGLVNWFIRSLVTLDPRDVLEKGFDAAATTMIRGH